MPTLKLIDFSGNAAGDRALMDAVFAIEPNTHVMHLHLVRQMANWRSGTHSTLTRSEVSGGGKKPWKQKGTGRARSGSSRSPLWRHGGVIFGPKPFNNYTKAMPRKMRRLALRSALSAKVNDLIGLTEWKLEAPSTKTVVSFLAKAGATGKVLIILDAVNEIVTKSARNIAGVTVILAQNLNVKDLLNHDKIVVTPAALQRIEEVFA
ncbi:50S ribosomal protein L4 [compost metagenome]